MHILKSIEKNPNLMGFNNRELIFAEIAKGHITIRDIIAKYAPNTNENENNPVEETLTQWSSVQIWPPQPIFNPRFLQ